MIDKKWIKLQLPSASFTVDRGRLQFFAKAIGETNSVYSDLDAAKAAGYADLPAPPTFLFAAELDAGSVDHLLEQLQVPIAKILHGEQGFTYHRSAVAGDHITVQSTIDDIYDKKGGALEFVVKSSKATNQRGELVAEMRSILVVRH